VAGTITLGHHQCEIFGTADLPLLLPAASMLAGAILAEQLRAATSKEAEEKTLLYRELDHRVRNNLAALISLLHLAAEGAAGDASETLREMADRYSAWRTSTTCCPAGEPAHRAPELAEVVAKNVLTALPGEVQIHWRVFGVVVHVPRPR
jgi:hypothetical protein